MKSQTLYVLFAGLMLTGLGPAAATAQEAQVDRTELPVLAAPDVAPDRPNIVLINMDNFGYGELGVYGGGILRGGATPRIDKLALSVYGIVKDGKVYKDRCSRDLC